MRYCCRAHVFDPLCCYELIASGLVRQGPDGEINISFSDIAEIIVFKERRLGSSRSYWACTITVTSTAQQYRLTSAHRVGPLKTEDRTETYIPFIKQFEDRALAANPSIRFVEDEFRQSIWNRIAGTLSLWMIALVGHLTRRQAASVCGALVRWTGPLLRGHRHARRQLKAVFPAMSDRDARMILHGMWDNIGRTFGEYAHLAELMNFTADRPAAGQVVMDDRTVDLWRDLGSRRNGALMFAAHLGNWEIPAMTARVFGRDIALVYKPQPSQAMTSRLIAVRSLFAGRLIEAGPEAPREMLRALHDGWLVGMLVDQHYEAGIDVSFLGHPCRVNPLIARLAQMRNVPVYGARVVRLADQRHRFELVGPLEFARDAAGKIDVQRAMQTVFDLIEGWIREHPEQWLWIHRILR